MLRKLLDQSWSLRVLLGPSGSFWALISLTEPYWALLGLTGPYWVLLNLTVMTKMTRYKPQAKSCQARDTNKVSGIVLFDSIYFLWFVGVGIQIFSN